MAADTMQLRAYAERLADYDLAWWQGLTGDCADMRAGICLARAFRTEHPLDDDEPATEEWCRALVVSLGATQRPKERPGDDEVFELELPNGFILFWHQNTEGYESNTWHYGVEHLRSWGLPDQHTRGDVLRLLTVLGARNQQGSVTS